MRSEFLATANRWFPLHVSSLISRVSNLHVYVNRVSKAKGNAKARFTYSSLARRTLIPFSLTRVSLSARRGAKFLSHSKLLLRRQRASNACAFEKTCPAHLLMHRCFGVLREANFQLKSSPQQKDCHFSQQKLI